MGARDMRVLLAEDDPQDAELEIRSLERAGLSIVHRHVASEPEFVRALVSFGPDVVLSDFSMPGFDGTRALALAKQHAPHVPFIFVSGTLGEETAVRALKDGAVDYILKSNLIRLPAAVERAIKGAEEARARRLAETGLRRAQQMARLAHVITGPGGGFESWSESLPDLLGIAPSDIVDSTRAWLEFIHPADRESFRAAALRAAEQGRRADVEYRARRKDGAWIHIRQAIEPLGGHGVPGLEGRWFSMLQDVTEQKQSSEAVRRLNRVHAVLSGITSLVVRTTDTEQLFAEACELAVRHGQFLLAWIGLLDTGRTRINVVASAGSARGYLEGMRLGLTRDASTMLTEAVRTGVMQVANDLASDPRILRKEEARAHGLQSAAVLPFVVDQEVVGLMGLYAEQVQFFDDAERRLLNDLAANIAFAIDHIRKGKRLEFVSHFDELTSLAKQPLLLERFRQAAGATPERVCALVLLDVERFKSINDSFGPAAGDALLVQLGRRLAELTGDATRVARTGPNEFAVMIPGVRAMEKVARTIEEGVRRIEGEPFSVAGEPLRIAIRCGIAAYPADGADADAVFRHAEAALKNAKRRGDKYLFYTQEMTDRVAERLGLENRLRMAVEREQFVLHYQPKVRLSDRAIVGFEALIRWQTAEGLVPPLEFIAILEETGLIAEAGTWALRRAARDRRAWVEAGLRAPRVAVNVSAIQLRRAGFVSRVQEALGTDAGIDLEITEGVIMDDVAAMTEKLRAVRALGPEIAIDDFGTGYSSLAYLTRLPVQALKIDRAFVSRMEEDANAMNVVSTIISLAHSLRLKVIAEGVETESQAAALARLGCDEMQGYLVSKPLAFDAAAALLSGASLVR